MLLAAGARSTLSRRPNDAPLGTWLGPALLIGGVASLNFALFPSVYSYWVYTGDILQFAFCVLLTCGIVAELRASVRRAIEVAVLEERRRLARDLHDGVAQELAFIASEIVDVPPDLHPSLPWIRSAVERALYESRRAIAALTMPLDQPLAAAVAAAAEDVTERSGATLQLELDETFEVPAAQHEAMLRVVREAATNAVKHGHACTVRVRLARSDDGSTLLAIADDGAGLDLGTVVSGFGFTSMRERVSGTGGDLRLESAPGAGTRVEALWPAATGSGHPRPGFVGPVLVADSASALVTAGFDAPETTGGR
jgi:signal transduction histidine kinase